MNSVDSERETVGVLPFMSNLLHPCFFGGVHVAILFSFLCCSLFILVPSCAQMLPVSLDCAFLIDPSDFYNVYLHFFDIRLRFIAVNHNQIFSNINQSIYPSVVHPQFYWHLCCSVYCFLCSILLIIVCSVVLFVLVIDLSVLLCFTASGHPFVILKPFILKKLYLFYYNNVWPVATLVNL